MSKTETFAYLIQRLVHAFGFAVLQEIVMKHNNAP